MFFEAQTQTEEELHNLLKDFYDGKCYEECPCNSDCDDEFIRFLRNQLEKMQYERSY